MKQQINPRDITPILPNMFILELEDCGALRYRLAGTALTDARGEDITGADFLELQSTNLRKLYSDAFSAALGNPCGVALGRTLVLPDARQLRLMQVALPCRGQDGRSKFIIGATEFLSNRPVWSSSEVAAHTSARMIKCRYLDLGWGVPGEATLLSQRIAQRA